MRFANRKHQSGDGATHQSLQVSSVKSKHLLAAVSLATTLTLAGVAYLASADQNISLQAKDTRYSPILPLATSFGEPLFLTESLQDPMFLKHQPEDSLDAGRLASEIKNYRYDLQKAALSRQIELHELAYESAAALSYYMYSQRQTELRGQPTRARSSNSDKYLASVRRGLLNHGSQFIKLSGRPTSASLRAQYHVLTTRYLMGMSRSAALQGLRKLLRTKLDTQLKDRITLLIATGQATSGTVALRRSGRQDLRALLSKMPSEAAVGARLTIATSLAGFTVSGQRVERAQKAYQNHLYQASKMAADLDSASRTVVQKRALGIWKRHEGGNPTTQPPVYFSPSDTRNNLLLATLERKALGEWFRGNKKTAVGRLTRLNEMPLNQSHKLALDLRIVQMSQKLGPKAYEQALVNAQLTYKAGDRDAESFVQNIQPKSSFDPTRTARNLTTITSLHKTFVDRGFRLVSQKNSSKNQIRSFIVSAKRYLQFADEQEGLRIKAQLAKLHGRLGEHQKAVDLYRQLIASSNGTAKKRFMLLAIASQSTMAEWPTKVDFRKQTIAKATERQILLDLYRDLSTLSPNSDWFALSHTGLLQINLGSEAAAFDTWRGGLQMLTSRSQRNFNFERAAGYMLGSYQVNEAWQDLEDLARLCRTKSIKARSSGGYSDTYALLALALLEGGKEALQAGSDQPESAKTAVAKLEEVARSLKKFARIDEATYLLSHAYRGVGRHDEAVNNLISFVKDYPRSAFRQPALGYGAEWTVAMAYEESAIYFMETFNRSYPKHDKTPEFRNLLIDLYQGRGLYAETLATVAKQSSDQRSTPTERQNLQVLSLELTSKHGATEQANTMARAILSSKETSELARSDAFITIARSLATKGDTSKLRQLAAELGREISGPDSIEALGEVNFLLAEAIGSGLKEQHYNLGLTSPEKTLQEQHQRFEEVESAYRQVCEVGQSSFCVPAMHQLARLAESFAESLQDISVQETLAKEVVASFYQTRDRLMAQLVRVSENADSKAMATLSQGNTSPDWTGQVLWQNSSDLNLDRVSGSSGNGYVQYSSEL